MQAGDTINGEIDFQDWQVSPSTIYVRENARVRQYARADLKGFVIEENNLRYEVLNTKLQYHITQPVKQGQSSVERTEPVSVYAEVLFANKSIALYSLQDDLQDERFFIRKDDEIKELVHYIIPIEKDGKLFNQEINAFRGQLRQALMDCDVKVNERLPYGSPEIVSLLRKYSECKGDATSSVERKEKKGLVMLGLMNGFSTYRDATQQPVLVSGDYFFGLDLQALSKRRHNRNFVWVEAGLMPGVRGHDEKPYLTHVVFAFYGGTYFGKGKVQPLVYVGGSSVVGIFDSGAGVGFNKRVVFTAGGKLVASLLGGGESYHFSFKLKVYPRLRPKA